MEQVIKSPASDEGVYKSEGPFIQTDALAHSSDFAFEWFVENKPNMYVLTRLDLYAAENAEARPSGFGLDAGSAQDRGGF
jgi:hypothetical protein